VGPGKHAVTYRLRGGKLANFVGVVERSDWRIESWTETGSWDEALADFSGWAPEITKIIEVAKIHYRWALFERAPLEKWTDGRVTLLGDSCHPMLPFMAQGATMAIEDAWVLAEKLSGTVAVPDALIAFEKSRKPRTSMVQNRARKNMDIYHQKTRFGQIKTYLPMWLANIIVPGFVASRLDSIYAHNVVKNSKAGK
jgi:salicylate hydroxylase